MMIMQNKILNFRQGLRDALPIGLGYFSVSAAFGMICINSALPGWAAPLMSLTNFTGTGQFVGASMIAVHTVLAEILLTIAVINARYFLMSVSLSQRLSSKCSFFQRSIIAFGITDEVFAVAMQQNKTIGTRYYVGLMTSAYSGWIIGTVLGTLVGSIIPVDLVSAMGIAIYAMFIAIVIPPLKKSRAILAVVAMAAAINCILYYVPLFSFLDNGLTVIVSGIAASLLGALLFPQEPEVHND